MRRRRPLEPRRLRLSLRFPSPVKLLFWICRIVSAVSLPSSLGIGPETTTSTFARSVFTTSGACLATRLRAAQRPDKMCGRHRLSCAVDNGFWFEKHHRLGHRLESANSGTQALTRELVVTERKSRKLAEGPQLLGDETCTRQWT